MQRKSISLGYQHGGNRGFIVAVHCFSVHARINTHGVHTRFNLHHDQETTVARKGKKDCHGLEVTLLRLRLT